MASADPQIRIWLEYVGAEHPATAAVRAVPPIPVPVAVGMTRVKSSLERAAEGRAKRTAKAAVEAALAARATRAAAVEDSMGGAEVMRATPPAPTTSSVSSMPPSPSSPREDLRGGGLRGGEFWSGGACGYSVRG